MHEENYLRVCCSPLPLDSPLVVTQGSFESTSFYKTDPDPYFTPEEDSNLQIVLSKCQEPANNNTLQYNSSILNYQPVGELNLILEKKNLNVMEISQILQQLIIKQKWSDSI